MTFWQRIWAGFCLYTMNLPETNFKTGLMSLAEKISRPHNAVFVAWLFLLMLPQVYHEKNWGRKKVQNVPFGEKRTLGSLMLQSKHCGKKGCKC